MLYGFTTSTKVFNLDEKYTLVSMSSSAPSPPSPPSSTTAIDSSRAQAQLIHTVSIACVVLCPVILALPPRKLDVYSVALVSSTLVGGNQLAQEYTGRSILTRIKEVGAPQPRRITIPAPDNAIHHSLTSRVSGSTIGREADRSNAEPFGESKTNLTTRILVEVQKKKSEEEHKSVLSETRGKSQWKKERDDREKEALEEGKGYGDMISEQIWEVWNWGKDKTTSDTEDGKLIEQNKYPEGKR